jgi:hypothetical protein
MFEVWNGGMRIKKREKIRQTEIRTGKKFKYIIIKPAVCIMFTVITYLYILFLIS